MNGNTSERQAEQPHREDVEIRWDKGDALVIPPDQGVSYWQPKPANGYVEFKVTPRNCRSNAFGVFVQVVPPGGFVREHAHDRHEEVLFCFEGCGTIIVDGVAHDFIPGTAVFCGRWVRHKICADKSATLKFIATILPPQLDQFFESIGRPRAAGEVAPQPFERPEDVLEVESRTGFARPA